MIQQILLGAAMSGGSSYASLNPSDKSSSITLSGSNLVASANASSSNSNGIARSTIAITGKRYFEAVFTSTPGSGAVVAAGVANSSHSLTASLGYANANGWAFWGISVGARHNGVTAVSGTGSGGDVFGFAVDEPNHKIWIRKNGAWIQGDPVAATSPIWTDLSGTLYAAACPWGNGTVVTMRFDPASFRDSAPTGFSPIS